MSKLQIISFQNKDEWNDIVKLFDLYDVYYLNEYVSAFRYTNDGYPLLIYYCGNSMRLCYPVQQSDIAECKSFGGILELGKYYDWSTPYGYGGPLTENFNEHEMKDFFNLLNAYCKSSNIVTQFIRFHPLLQNHKSFEEFCELRKLKKTVFIDTACLDTIYNNSEARCRGAIKKAQNNNISIKIDNSKEAKSTFIEMYNDTMLRKNAAEYYSFSRIFFDDFFSNMSEHYNIFCGIFEDKIICSDIIMHCNGNMHYHLSASRREYMHLAPNNLLLYTAACWGAENGYKKFHLGGGVESDDSLLLFKKSFNKEGLIDFYIGRNIFCEEAYQELLDIRATANSSFNTDNSYLIQYRL
jgi:hypothetical protein